MSLSLREEGLLVVVKKYRNLDYEACGMVAAHPLVLISDIDVALSASPADEPAFDIADSKLVRLYIGVQHPRDTLSASGHRTPPRSVAGADWT